MVVLDDDVGVVGFVVFLECDVVQFVDVGVGLGGEKIH